MTHIKVAMRACRVLAVLANGDPKSMAELYRWGPLNDLSDQDIACAVRDLLVARRITRRIAPVWYQHGDRFLRRNVPVYAVRKGGGA